MPVFLESQIGLLEHGAPSPDATEVEDLIAFHLTALERLESRLGPGGISEADRPLVPLFQRWLSAARHVKEFVRDLQSKGRVVGGYDDLLRAMNRSKPMAERFDHFVALNERLSNEQAAGGV
jgi:hypothetical protein